MLKHIGRALAWGLPLAATWGLLESSWYYFFGSAVVVGGPRLLTSGILIYLILALMACVPAGIGMGLLKKLGRAGDGDKGFYGAFWSSLGIVLVIGYYVNSRWLGGSLDTSSLIFDAVLIGLMWPFLLRLLTPSFAALARLMTPRRILTANISLVGIALLGMLGPDPRSGAAPPTTSAPANAPNVLFVLIDTLRADHLSSYGYHRQTSPRIDQLAAEGILFENCISQAPHTKPSTASILTSLYPPTHKVELFTSSLDTNALTLPEMLHAGGWRTSLMSANTFLSPTYGFGEGVETFRGSVVNPSFQLIGASVFHRLRRVFVKDMHLWRDGWDLLREIANWPFMSDGDDYQHGMTAAQLENEFFSWHGQLEGDAPWFSYLQFMEPHAPYEPALEHQIFDNPNPIEAGAWFPSKRDIMFLPFAPGDAIPESERAGIIANYDSCIHEVDAAIGRIIDRLDQSGELDNTLVIITSDHGEEFFEHGAWGHGHSLHRELVHVPLIMRSPRHFPAGIRVPSQVRSVDIMPSILATCGLKTPEQAAGLALPLLADAQPREVFSEVLWGGHFARSLRTNDGTAIYAKFANQEAQQFFGIGDIAEAKDLAASQVSLSQQLHQQLNAEHQRLAANALAAKTAAVDDGTQANLADLGYLESEEEE